MGVAVPVCNPSTWGGGGVDHSKVGPASATEDSVTEQKLASEASPLP